MVDWICPLFPTHFLLYPADSPVCSASNVGIVGASLEESVTIPCRVSADPAIVDFEWTFSSSGERFEVPPGHYVTMQDTQSIGHGDSSHTEMDGKNWAIGGSYIA